ncbi:cyclic pyranopterin monophosphate synthase [Ruminiclostridium hungatei]|uniref:Cyclic pyranopterin monophosphate synthase n=1 Tax=Ruminiclostridium hungatei TaxID=48256 RepID=A0A1V4SM84_RUMHU|nr:TatD family nuclease-associated radical SAM protein [Ruminiclostridium hungatei]OPX44988.1 cyclic pyranopterin monophosphate synthase [Ruminiclostridium hungatei]
MITYEIGNKLYINITNRCTNQCGFCVRNDAKGIGFDLWLEKEPTVDEIIKAVDSAGIHDEFVFCGYGEPTLRLPEIIETAKYLKKFGKPIRIDTNGQADLIWKRSVARELAGYIDAISISLNASNGIRYQELCISDFGVSAFDSIISFAKDCVRFLPKVTMSVVDLISEDEIEKCARIAEEIGAGFKVRHFNG